MPWYIVAGNPVHLNLGRRAGPPQCVARVERDGKIAKCCGISGFACDWEYDDGRTCDAPMCAEHANEIGRNKHLCDLHLAQHRAAKPELF